MLPGATMNHFPGGQEAWDQSALHNFRWCQWVSPRLTNLAENNSSTSSVIACVCDWGALAPTVSRDDVEWELDTCEYNFAV